MDSTEESPENDAQAAPRRGPILWVLVATLVVFALPLEPTYRFRFNDWYLPCLLLWFGLMAVSPFVLARIAPRTASFDARWFPGAWWHWALFLGMVFLLFVASAVAYALANVVGYKPWPVLVIPTASSVILAGVIAVIVGPIAEEIFWRGYVLEQLRKLTHSGVALLTHSFLFGLAHLQTSSGIVALLQAFLFGVVLGMWRIRFRSLLPLILAHMIFNGVIAIPRVVEQYRNAKLNEPVADDLAEYAKNVRSNPKCRQIEALTKEPLQKAVPAIIDYFADPDKDVRTYAESILIEYYRNDAEPYMKAVLSSRDKNTLEGALFVVGTCGYSGFKQEVRDIAWAVDAPMIQLSAVLTLWNLEDEEGLRKIAQGHPNETVRGCAERCLADPLRPKPPDSSPPAEQLEPPAKSTPTSR